jgi:2-isopropylmalate synthase
MFAQPHNKRIYLFDTTLRDGAQTYGVDFSVEDKIRIARMLDALGIPYIEGGYPGANETDNAFFANPPVLTQAKLVGFGMTRRPGRSASNDPGLQGILNAATHSCLVGKTWDWHVTGALNTTTGENLAIIESSIAAGVSKGNTMLFDAEHFFDGYKANPGYALDCLKAAQRGGAEWLVLCDTNGGAMPGEVKRIVTDVCAALPGARIGIHTHNDRGFADANSIMAVDAGATMVQGTLNGLGERCGNANLITLIPTLDSEGYDVGVLPKKLRSLTSVSRTLDEMLGRSPNTGAPYVGVRAGAHNGGIHTAAVQKNPRFYEHSDPDRVGNDRLIVVSDQSGAASVSLRLNSMGITVDEHDPRLRTILETIKERSARGYAYDTAPESFALAALEILEPRDRPFDIVEFTTSTRHTSDGHGHRTKSVHAHVGVSINGDTHFEESDGDGNGQVNAIDRALHKVLEPHFPELAHTELSEYKVRILNSRDATAATTRVLLEMTDKQTGISWRSIGVSTDIVEASVEALCDGYEYFLRRSDPGSPYRLVAWAKKNAAHAAPVAALC